MARKDKLPDILAHNLDIVFCGTAAGAASARRGAYYAGPGNSFWRILHETGLTPSRLQPEAFKTLSRYGLGLTDLAKKASGADSDLAKTDFDTEGLRERIARYQPSILAFNGKNAAETLLGRPVEYGEQKERIGHTRIFVLPSTSGAARKFWNEGMWHKLARTAKCPLETKPSGPKF